MWSCNEWTISIYKRPDVGHSEVYLNIGFNEAVRPREATLHNWLSEAMGQQ